LLVLIKRVLRRMYRVLQGTSTTSLISIPNDGRNLGGVDVLGFFTSEHGVGEAARVLTETLQSVSIPVSTIDYIDTESRREHSYSCDNSSQFRVLLASINSDQLLAAHHRISQEFFSDRYVIGQWFWELEESPPWFAPAFPLLNELWAPSRFVEAMLLSCVPSSIHVEYIPLPVRPPVIDSSLMRSHFGLDNRYMFLFVFDFMSVMKRKNPLGLIDAFSRAFVEGEGPQLVIKGINGDKRPAEYEALREAVTQRTDITLIDKYFTRSETTTLISFADCYVSLHRSEGLGLTISEAMSLGVPVIATGYSGNLDFMDDTNSKLVAPLMRVFYENSQRGREIGERGQRDILSTHSVERCGAIMKNRLDNIWRSLHGN